MLVLTRKTGEAVYVGQFLVTIQKLRKGPPNERSRQGEWEAILRIEEAGKIPRRFTVPEGTDLLLAEGELVPPRDVNTSLDDAIRVAVLVNKVHRGEIRLGFIAPDDILILRAELKDEGVKS